MTETTTALDLQPFCCTSRHQIMQPFSIGAFTFATDGVVCVRVPRRPDIPERDEAPDATDRLRHQTRNLGQSAFRALRLQ